MFYLWPSEGLYDNPPFWFTNAWIYVFSTVFKGMAYLIATYPAYMLSVSLFLLAPFYRKWIRGLEKAWRKIQVNACRFFRKLSIVLTTFKGYI
jgi:hypothetical protein